MNHDIEITQLDLVKGGNVIRQGHHFTLDFTPRGENGDVIALTGKDVYAVFYDKNGIRYEGAAEYVSSDAVIRVEITKNIGHGTMWIEFTATDPNDVAYKKKFPARENNARISITPSSDDLGFVGVKSITVEQLRTEQATAQQEFESVIVPKVESIETQQLQLSSDFLAAAGALTEDSEVILARMGEETLPAFNQKVIGKLADTGEKTDNLYENAKTLLEYTSQRNGDITTALKTMIAYLRNKANTDGIHTVQPIQIPAGRYTITETIELPTYIKLKVFGTVILNYTGTGSMFHVYNTNEVVSMRSGFAQMPFNVGSVIDGSEGSLIFKGLGRTSGQTAIRIGEPVIQTLYTTATAWCSFANFYIEGFQKAYSFTQKQTYILRFYNVVVSHCGTIITDEADTKNAGELLTWTDCAFHNSDLFLEVNSEINHLFKGCSIDYNSQGIKFTNTKYNTQRFTDCWIEGSNTLGEKPFAESLDTSPVSFLVFKGCHIFFTDRKADVFLKGKMKVSFDSNEYTLNRYTDKKTASLARSAFLCDDNVEVVSDRASMFHENTIAASKTRTLNQNVDFELDEVDATTFTGFTKLAGGASAKISSVRSFTGTKSIELIGGTGTYADLETEVFNLQYAERIYGQLVYYLDSVKPSLALVTRIFFYQDDGVTQVGSPIQIGQDITVNVVDGNKWYALASGFSTTTGKPIQIPPRATKAKARITVGNIGSASVFIDSFAITPI